jgi:hypothetical protein
VPGLNIVVVLQDDAIVERIDEQAPIGLWSALMG